MKPTIRNTESKKKLILGLLFLALTIASFI